MNWTRKIFLLVLGLAACCALSAVQTPPPPSTDYSFFKIIADRNIFNPNRRPHVVETFRPPPSVARVEPAVDLLSLVGTMIYEKGTFAFFDGSSADYKKVLKLNGEVAGFKVAAIRPNSVILSSGGKKMELKVGMQLNREPDSGWHIVDVPVMPLSALTNAPVSFSSNAPIGVIAAPAASSPGAPASAPASNVDQSDILKRLMQQRERELK